MAAKFNSYNVRYISMIDGNAIRFSTMAYMRVSRFGSQSQFLAALYVCYRILFCMAEHYPGLCLDSRWPGHVFSLCCDYRA